jgi:hypothetical protein
MFIKIEDVMFNTTAKAFIKNESISSLTLIDDIKAKYTKEFSKSFGEKSSNDYIDKIKSKYTDGGRDNAKFNTDKMIEEKMRKYRNEIKNDCISLENGGRQNFQNKTEIIDESNKDIIDKLKSIEETLNNLNKEKEKLAEQNEIKVELQKTEDEIKTAQQSEPVDDNFDHIIPLVERITKLKEIKHDHDTKCHKK